MVNPVDFNLYLITDRHAVPGGDLLAAVEGALAGGVQAVQLREKDLAADKFLALALRLRELTARYGARLLINRRLETAWEVGADGLHLGAEAPAILAARRRLGPGALLGVSAHSLEELHLAREAGADFVTFGPVWFTPSKAGFGEPVGPERLAAASAAAPFPVFALGGVTVARVPQLLAAGARGAAAIGALLAATDPGAAARAFRDALDALQSPAL